MSKRTAAVRAMPLQALDTETRYRLLKRLDEDPSLSQRALAAELGISLGKANYCVRALIDRGWVKMVNFGRSDNKAAYAYKLTPTGIREKVNAAHRFLKQKRREHDRITGEIQALHEELLAAEERRE